MEQVYFEKLTDYEPKALDAAVSKAFAALQLEELISPGMRVVIKPNLIMRSKSEAGIITHPAVVAAVGRKVKELGASVLIAESSGGPYSPGVMKSTFSYCGYTAIAEENGFDLYTECKYRTVDYAAGNRCKQFTVVEPFLNADLIIDIAKLKTHGMTLYSGAVKNMFGVVPGLMKPELHCRFPEKPAFGEMLVDLCELTRPRICFMDGIMAMEGNGPTGGSPRFMGYLGASKSPYALDSLCCTTIGIDPMEVLMLQNAHARGLCPLPEEVEVLGVPVEELRVTDFKMPDTKSVDFVDHLPKFLRPLATKLTTPYPKIPKNKCIGCGKCAESCPAHTITVENGKATVHKENCIRCFCCHEMCPLHIVEIQRFRLFNL